MQALLKANGNECCDLCGNAISEGEQFWRFIFDLPDTMDFDVKIVDVCLTCSPPELE